MTVRVLYLGMTDGTIYSRDIAAGAMRAVYSRPDRASIEAIYAAPTLEGGQNLIVSLAGGTIVLLDSGRGFSEIASADSGLLRVKRAILGADGASLYCLNGPFNMWCDYELLEQPPPPRATRLWSMVNLVTGQVEHYPTTCSWEKEVQFVDFDLYGDLLMGAFEPGRVVRREIDGQESSETIPISRDVSLKGIRVDPRDGSRWFLLNNGAWNGIGVQREW